MDNLRSGIHCAFIHDGTPIILRVVVPSHFTPHRKSHSHGYRLENFSIPFFLNTHTRAFFPGGGEEVGENTPHPEVGG